MLWPIVPDNLYAYCTLTGTMDLRSVGSDRLHPILSGMHLNLLNFLSSHTHEHLVLSSCASVEGLGLSSLIWPNPVVEALGSAPYTVPLGEVPPVAGWTPSKKRSPVRFSGDGGSHGFYLVHHLFSFLGKLRAE